MTAGFRQRALAALAEPVDNGPLVVFRIGFGALLALEAGGSIATGWVRRVFIDPEFTFPIIGFGWLQPLPGDAMYAYYAVMAVLALLVAAGAWFRPALLVFTAMWTAVYVMQTTSYNNHYYLLSLLCLLLASTPANARLSVDASREPSIASDACPRWCLLVFVAQTAILYFFAAVAKLDADWLAARPLAIWLPQRSGYPLIGFLYETAWLKWLLAYGGLAFDALIVPALLWSRTRRAAVVAALGFHLFNSLTFRVGIFPYLGILLCVFFFPPQDVTRRLLPTAPRRERAPAAGPTQSRQLGVVAALCLFFVVQLALPLRHWLYPGNVNWTEEGYRMSWRMMLRSKSGAIRFKVEDPSTGEDWIVDPKDRLSPKQAERIGTRPDLIWQFAQRLEAEHAAEGGTPVRVYARGKASLNGRPWQPLVDPAVDLAAEPWPWLGHADWIVPLKE